MKNVILTIIEIIFIPLTFISALWLKFVRKYIVKFWGSNSRITRSILEWVGIFPILDHYYEPNFSSKSLKLSSEKKRVLTGINFNELEQLNLLNQFDYSAEIMAIDKLPIDTLNFSFRKGPFKSGDAEYLYNIIRYKKPKRIIEIGSGHSTLMARHAINRNEIEDDAYTCKHICVEPYENSWLESLNVEVVREKVENLSLVVFRELEENDILFIDSSHIIRPNGDVLFEYLQVLPILNKGVLVHIHDIFSPRDYLEPWLRDGLVFWNEQYLLEAFLTLNSGYKIIGSLNYLKHNHYNSLLAKCPMLSDDREPGSFWIERL